MAAEFNEGRSPVTEMRDHSGTWPNGIQVLGAMVDRKPKRESVLLIEGDEVE